MIDGHELFTAQAAVLTGVVVAQQHILLRQRDFLHRAADVIQHPDDRR